MDLRNKAIIVTGASSGIGAAATPFAREGANVVLGARSGHNLAEVAERAGGQTACLAGDVKDPDYAPALVALARWARSIR